MRSRLEDLIFCELDLATASKKVQYSHHAKSHQKVPPTPHGKPLYKKRRFQQIQTCQVASGVDTVCVCVDTQYPSQKPVLKPIASSVDTVCLCVDTLRLKPKNGNFYRHVLAWESRDLTYIFVPTHPKAPYGHMGL
ncbi:hypothetical protein Taro_030336 [Colocasia esculenta]|uniref:Uncharacterized protein n=1 Tax=Colocasia esculenta TaxID=4460 RepID=A0A843W314_COLES|nr:hypothetical protein [Colocasia esculenta]